MPEAKRAQSVLVEGEIRATLNPCNAERKPTMANLTITIEDDLLKKARIRALEQGTSVNALLRDYLVAYALPESPAP